nr:hypothetical protein BaRGS_000072 [Batillaria attramentaria]
MAKLNRLVMKDIGFTGVDSGIFEHVTKLDVLDIRGNPLSSFKQDVFADLTELSDLLTDDPRLCCDFYHEYTQLMECVSPRNELSSCSDLLKGDFFRVVLWGLSLLAVIGNVSVLIYRLCVETGGTSSLPYRMLVSNMAMSDLLMGVYMLIIGAADTRFRDVYVAEEENWKRSNTCKTAGFLAFVSSEVSAFVICLITIDRMLVLRFPFSSRLRLTKRSVWLACGAAWGIGLTLAAVPLFKSDWQFYGQNGLCLPLPITRLNFKGQQYAFDIFIILNFVIFLLIGGGQVFIFWTIRDSAKKADKDSWRKTTAVARRLFLIVITDFLCWFPIGLMGLLATYGGAPIPDVVYVWASIVILPLNSAFNPFLYTLTTLLQRRGERRRAARVEMTIRRLHSEILSWPRSKIEELVLYIHKSNLIEKKKLQQLLGISPQHDVVNTSRIVSRDHGQVTEPNAPQEMLKDGPASCGVDVEFGKGCNSVCKTCVTEVTESSEQSCQRDGELRTCKVHVHSADVHVDGPL